MSDASIPATTVAAITNETRVEAPAGQTAETRSGGSLVGDEAPTRPQLDLDGIESDLADVELALTRLDNGQYWSDEITGAQIPDEHLADRPTTRRFAER